MKSAVRPTLLRFQHSLEQACGAFAVSGLEDERARITTTRMAGYEAVDLHLGKSCIERSTRAARADHLAHFFLVRQVSGEAIMEQGCGVRVRPGDFYLASSRRASIFSYGGPARQLSLHLPFEPVRHLLGRDLSAGVHLRARSVVARSLSRALSRTQAQQDLPDLLAAILNGGAEPDLALADAAIRISALRACDPRFSPARLADLLGVDLRKLQRALSNRQMSASRIILDHRLKRVSHLLRTAPDQTILACATEAGFADISAFNRVFRRECGMTPGAFRRAYCRD